MNTEKTDNQTTPPNGENPLRNPKNRKKAFWGVLAGCALAAILLGVVNFSNYLGASAVAPNSWLTMINKNGRYTPGLPAYPVNTPKPTTSSTPTIYPTTKPITSPSFPVTIQTPTPPATTNTPRPTQLPTNFPFNFTPTPSATPNNTLGFTAGYMPIWMMTMCTNTDPYTFQTGYYAESMDRAGLEYRKSNTNQSWSSAGFTVSQMVTKDLLGMIPVSETKPAPTGKLEPNTRYEARFIARPDVIFNFTTPLKSPNRYGGWDCSGNLRIPTSLKGVTPWSSPAGLMASNLSVSFESPMTFSFNTNKRVFATQLNIEINEKGYPRAGATPIFNVITRSSALFRAAQSHTYKLDFKVWKPKTSYTIQVQDASGGNISSVYEFTTP